MNYIDNKDLGDVNMKCIDTVIFDIGNVLIDFCWRDAFRNMQLDEVQWKRLWAATIGNQLWNEFDRGIMTDEEIVASFIETDSEIEPLIHDFFDNHYDEIVRKFDYADEWVDSLKSHGYKIYFLSNFSRRGFEVFDKELDFVKKGDGEVISYRVGMIKPNHDIYELLLEKYNINPKEAVFIDDTLNNIVAAGEVGLNTIHFQNREQAVEELAKLGIR